MGNKSFSKEFFNSNNSFFPICSNKVEPLKSSSKTGSKGDKAISYNPFLVATS